MRRQASSLAPLERVAERMPVRTFVELNARAFWIGHAVIIDYLHGTVAVFAVANTWHC